MLKVSTVERSAVAVQSNAGSKSGLEYIVSEQKVKLDKKVAGAILPLARLGAAVTELAIFGHFSDEHRFTQVRNGVNGSELVVPKIRTMRPVEAGVEVDIDRYSPRIHNKRALLARVIGLDELPQWELVANGEMSLVGPRPLLQESMDRFSSLAEAGGAASEDVDEWREFLGVARPGLFGKSQAMRHRRNFKEYTPEASVAIIEADLEYKRYANLALDLGTIATAATVTVTEGLKSI